VDAFGVAQEVIEGRIWGERDGPVTLDEMIDLARSCDVRADILCTLVMGPAGPWVDGAVMDEEMTEALSLATEAASAATTERE
jgi:hypothetical protein